MKTIKKITVPVSSISYFGIGIFIVAITLLLILKFGLHQVTTPESQGISSYIFWRALFLVVLGGIIAQIRLFRQAKIWKYEIVPEKRIIRKVNMKHPKKTVVYQYTWIADVKFQPIDRLLLSYWVTNKEIHNMYINCKKPKKIVQKLVKLFKKHKQHNTDIDEFTIRFKDI